MYFCHVWDATQYVTLRWGWRREWWVMTMLMRAELKRRRRPCPQHPQCWMQTVLRNNVILWPIKKCPTLTISPNVRILERRQNHKHYAHSHCFCDTLLVMFLSTNYNSASCHLYLLPPSLPGKCIQRHTITGTVGTRAYGLTSQLVGRNLWPRRHGGGVVRADHHLHAMHHDYQATFGLMRDAHSLFTQILYDNFRHRATTRYCK